MFFSRFRGFQNTIHNDASLLMDDVFQATFPPGHTDDPFYYLSVPPDIPHLSTDVRHYPPTDHPLGNALASNTISSNSTIESFTYHDSTSSPSFPTPTPFASMNYSSWMYSCEHTRSMSPGASSAGQAWSSNVDFHTSCPTRYPPCHSHSIPMHLRESRCLNVFIVTFITIIVEHDQQSPTVPQNILSPCIDDFLEQLIHGLSGNQCSILSTLTDLFRLLDLPCHISENINYHFLFLNALHIWKHQFKNRPSMSLDDSSRTRFAVLLCLFYSLLICQSHDERASSKDVIAKKLVTLLQENIQGVTGANRSLGGRLTAVFMKSLVTLSQHYSHGTNE